MPSAGLPPSAAPFLLGGRGIADTVVPIGVVTLIEFGSSPAPHSILYPGGRKVLKPWISSGLPAKSVLTLPMTPGVSIAPLLKSFMISRNRLYTSG